jgi:hypothetical protein
MRPKKLPEQHGKELLLYCSKNHFQIVAEALVGCMD